MAVTQKQAAQHLGLSVQALLDWLDKLDMPRRGFDLDALRLAYIKELRASAAGRKYKGRYDLEDERSRKEHHAANKAALEEAVRSGELVELVAVEKAYGELVLRLRSKLLALPAAMAAQVANKAPKEAQRMLQQAVKEALTELSSMV